MNAAREDLQDAFVRALYEEHAARLGRQVRRVLGTDEGVEDVVQETIVRAWSRRAQLARDGRPLGPWLGAVARNLAVDRLRAAGARPSVPLDGHPEPPAPDELERALESWEIAEAVAALPEAHRAVLVETHFRGRSVAQTAHVLGIPEGTVKSRAHNALRMLRMILVERGWNAP